MATAGDFELNLQEDPAEQNSCVVVYGVNTDLHDDETLAEAFEGGSAGGPVSKVRINENRKTALITFESREVAEKIVQNGRFKSEDEEFIVKAYQPFQVTSNSREVRVKGVKENTTEMKLKLFFKTKRKGGGPIQSIVVRHDKHDAIITFEKHEDAANIVKIKAFELKEGVKFETEWYVPTPEETLVQRSVVIGGLNEEIDAECLELIVRDLKDAENAVIEDIKINKKGCSAVIVFEDIKVAEQLQSLGSYTQDDLELSMSVYDLENAPVNEEDQEAQGGDKHDNKIIVSGFNAETTTERLKLFFENARRSRGGPIEDVDIISGNRAVVAFVNKKDAANVVNQNSFTMDGSELTVEWYLPENQDETTVLVEGISQGFTEDYLEDMFVNKDKTGGGDIERIEMMGDKVIIKFKDKNVAARVAARSEISTSIGLLKVQLYSESPVKSNIVAVCNMSKGMTAERIGLFMENKNKVDGGPVKSVQHDKDMGMFLVEFQHTEDAVRVATMGSLKIGKETADVQLFTKPQKKQETIKNPKSVLVEVTDGQIDEDTLEVVFENKKKSGGGPVESVNLSEDRKSAIVVFENIDDAQRVLQQNVIQLDNTSLRICGTAESKSVEQVSSKPMKDNAENNYPYEVTNIGSDSPKDYIQLFFESKDKSGGGEIEKLSFNANEGRAIIQFKFVKDTNAVWEEYTSNGLVLNERKLTLKKLDPSKLGDSAFCVNSCAIEITGMQSTNKSSEDLSEALQMLFENSKMSGGGKIEDLYLEEDLSRAVITFTVPEVATNVVTKHNSMKIELGDEVLQIKPLPVTGGLPIPESDHLEECQLFLQNLSEYVSNSELKTCVERHSKATVKQVIYGLNVGKALLEFNRQPAMDDLFQYLRMKPIKGNMVSFQRVALSKEIEVYNITTPKKISNMTIKLYFEHPSKSNSTQGCTVDVTRIDEHDCAIVTFDALQGMLGVLRKKDHVVERQKLRVQHHYSCIGILPLGHNKYEPTTSIPAGTTLPLDQLEVINFVLHNEPHNRHFMQAFGKIYADVSVDVEQQELNIRCKLRKDVKNYHVLAKSWCRDVEILVKSTLEKYSSNYLNVSKQGLDESLKEIEHMKTANVCLQYDSHTSKVLVVGYVDDVDTTCKKLLKKMEEIQQDIERRRNITEECFQVKNTAVADVLLLNSLPGTIEAEYKDMSVNIDRDTVKIRGVKDDIVQAKLKLFEQIHEMKTTEAAISEEIASMLEKTTVKKYVNQKLNERGFKTAYEVVKGKFIVHSLSANICEQAADFINKCLILKQKFQADENILKSSKWKSEQINLESQYHECFELRETHEGLLIVAIADVMDQIYTALEQFFTTNTIKEEAVQAKLGEVKVIESDGRALLEIMDRYSDCSIKIRCDYDRPGLKVKGSIAGLNNAVIDVKTLVSKVQYKAHIVDKPGMTNFFKEETGKQLIKTIENDHKVAIITGKEKEEDIAESFELVASVPLEDAPHSRELARIHIGVDVVILEDDLTMHQADCILVPSIALNLKYTQNNAGKILMGKAGDNVQRECDSHVSKNGRLLVADVFVSSAGNLPCKGLVHTTFPVWKSGKQREADFITEAFFKAMKSAAQKQFKSISIPGSILEMYPNGFALPCLCQAIKEFRKSLSQSSLKEIHIVADGVGTKFLLQKLIQLLQPIATEAYATAAAPVHHTSGPTTSYASDIAYKATADPSVLTILGVSVTVVKGAIAQQQVDVIVNTTSPDLNLKKGAVSLSLYSAGGEVIQQECLQIAQQGFSAGDIADTSGGKLKCKRVYHGNCPAYREKHADKVIVKFIDGCLNRAHSNGMTSIAIPAIGTGLLGYPHSFVAETMFERVKTFSQNNKATTLKDVRFIVYDKDFDTIKAFSEEIVALTGASSVRPKTGSRSSKSYRKRGSGATRSQNKNIYPDDRADLKPDSYPSSYPSHSSYYMNPPPSNYSSTSPSHNPSHGRNKAEITIGKMSLLVKKGDVTQENTDAIVNSTNSTMTFNSMVSKAILKVGGESIEQECKQLGRMTDNIAITGSGKLQCKKIIHLNAPGNDQKLWKERILQCLQLAEANQLTSIALPAVGTGQLGIPVSSMAETIMDATAEFSNTKNPIFLHVIRMVIFDEKMVGEFETHLQKIASSPSGKKKGFSLIGFVKGILGYQDDPSITDIPEVATSGDRVVDHPASVSDICPAGDITLLYEAMHVTIYGFQPEKITKAIIDIERICKEQCQERLIDGAADSVKISKLTNEQMHTIKGFQTTYPVLIQVFRGSSTNHIRIQGRDKDTANVYAKIKDVFHEAEIIEVRAKAEKELHDKIKWQYQDKDKYVDYPPNINFIIENAYNAKQPNIQWDEVDNTGTPMSTPSTQCHIIEFNKMVEHIVGNTECAVAVRRYAPASIELPTRWELMSPSENFKVVDVPKDDPDYEEVSIKFKDGITEGTGVLSSTFSAVNAVEIKSIKRVQNPRIYRNCLTRKNQMQMTLKPGHPCEHELWHGTSADTIEEINVNGFNRSYCGKNAVVYGDGVYFAVNANYSHRYAQPDPQGNRIMYLCRVLTGEFTKGNNGIKVPPPKDPAVASIKYDSVVDNVNQPAMYVVFFDDQAYPQYEITYTAT